jgi:hypothetical protein
MGAPRARHYGPAVASGVPPSRCRPIPAEGIPAATVLPDDSAVRVLLETHAAEIRAVLDRLAGTLGA